MATMRKDVLKVMKDWNAGKEIRALELGHVHRMKENPGQSPLINIHEHHHQDQDRAYAYCFHILEFYKAQGAAPHTWDEFAVECNALEVVFREENAGLTEEELHGAESLAWKAMLFGWAKAIDGHKDTQYIEVSKPEAESAR